MVISIESALQRLYPPEEKTYQVERYDRVVALLRSTGVERVSGSDRSPLLYSAPGRVEIGGNHTDHNGGRVLAAAVNQDIIAAVVPTKEPVITVVSEGWSEVVSVRIGESEPVPGERGSAALVRGLVSGFARRGIVLSGARVALSSHIAPGAGFSSSAALEMVMATALDDISNDGKLSLLERARIGQEAEHRFWNKPVGLLDQIASGTGGMIEIDFFTSGSPKVTHLDVDLTASGYQLLAVDSGGSHADLTSEYAAVPEDMQSVANVLGVGRLIETSESNVLSRLPQLRRKVGDRAILRALHFFAENRRVLEQVQALKARDMELFVSLVRKSGSSSSRLLQNCFVPGSSSDQPIALALGLSERIIGDSSVGAVRVHGGGFAGVVLAVLQRHRVDGFSRSLDAVFGPGACRKLFVRRHGVVNVQRMHR